MNKPKTSAKTTKTAKMKAKNLKLKTSVKAGTRFGWSNRCEILRRIG